VAWKISFKKETFKFLSKQDTDTQERIRTSLNSLLDYLERGIFPFNEMDIRKLKGQRKDFLRLRAGKIRIILKADTHDKEIRVYAIDYRGDVYKG
jgi:mRNA interferase RelE/StbE